MGVGSVPALRRVHGIDRRGRKAWVADLLPPARVGGGLGLYQCVSGGAALVAGVWAGLAWGGDGKVPLLVSGAVAACVAFALIVAGRRFDPESRP